MYKGGIKTSKEMERREREGGGGGGVLSNLIT